MDNLRTRSPMGHNRRYTKIEVKKTNAFRDAKEKQLGNTPVKSQLLTVAVVVRQIPQMDESLQFKPAKKIPVN